MSCTLFGQDASTRSFAVPLPDYRLPRSSSPSVLASMADSPSITLHDSTDSLHRENPGLPASATLTNIRPTNVHRELIRTAIKRLNIFKELPEVCDPKTGTQPFADVFSQDRLVLFLDSFRFASVWTHYYAYAPLHTHLQIPAGETLCTINDQIESLLVLTTGRIEVFVKPPGTHVPIPVRVSTMPYHRLIIHSARRA